MSEEWSFERTLEECLGWFEGFRRLGFSSDDVYFGCDVDEGRAITICMILRAQGKEFASIIGKAPPEFTPELLAKEWERVANRWNDTTVPEAERQRIYEQSFPRTSSLRFLSLVKEAGIKIPPQEDSVVDSPP